MIEFHMRCIYCGQREREAGKKCCSSDECISADLATHKSANCNMRITAALHQQIKDVASSLRVAKQQLICEGIEAVIARYAEGGTIEKAAQVLEDYYQARQM